MKSTVALIAIGRNRAVGLVRSVKPDFMVHRMMRHPRVGLAILAVVLFGLLTLLPGSAQEHPRSSPAEHPGLPAARSTNSDVHQAVRDYVKKRTSKGVFELRDPKSKRTRQLVLVKLHPATRVSGGNYFVCGDFTDKNRDRIDLDFDVASCEKSWAVSQVLVHKVNGKSRIGYKQGKGQWYRITEDRKRQLLTSETGTRVGNRAPNFTLVTLDGKSVMLCKLRGNPVVLNFWASWCPPCRAEAPEFGRTARTYASKGVKFIGVAASSPTGDANEFVQKYGMRYPNGISDKIARQYRVSSLPTTFFIDKMGNIQKVQVGMLREADLTNAIQAML